MAALAAVDRVELDLDRRPTGGVGELDLHRDRDVVSLRRAEATRTSAEEGVEEIADRAEPLEIRRVAAGAQPVVAVTVVGGSPLAVGEDLVGLGGLLELLLGLRVVGVDVGVQLARQRAEGFLDVLLGGVTLDAEHLVGVAWHGGLDDPFR